MIRCSMFVQDSRRCPNAADMQLKVERLIDGVLCTFVIVVCNDNDCLRRYAATVAQFQRDGATLSTVRLPRAAVLALKMDSPRTVHTDISEDR